MASDRFARWRRPWFLVEVFVALNLGGLAADIWIAHSVNDFRERAEWLPLWFSLASPIVLAVVLLAREIHRWESVWRDVGYLVGWLSIGLGLTGTVLHLQSGFFQSETLRGLVYAAPFAAPLAYAGLGLLLVANRMVRPDSQEWARWILLLTLGGFVGNFVFSLTDHAQNGFFRATEWIPVVAAALAVGFLTAPFATAVGRRYLVVSAWVLGLQLAVGALGFLLHNRANLAGPSPSAWDNFVYGAPPMAPLLFADLVVLGWIALWALHRATSDTRGPGA
jgi:hypothetical protein